MHIKRLRAGRSALPAALGILLLLVFAGVVRVVAASPDIRSWNTE